MRFRLTCTGWSLDSDLQIVHADVYMEADGETLIDEPLCIDVGLPALLLSAREDIVPDRWAQAECWQRMPFFICGCGDPECRAYSFIVKHRPEEGQVELIEVEEKPLQSPRELARYTVPLDVYAAQVKSVGTEFLRFVEGLDYRPYYKDTVETVKSLLLEMDNDHSVLR
jgi:hypothetical protein